MIGEAVLRKLLLARHIFLLARDSLRLDDPIHAATGLLLLQDSVETFLIAVAQHLNVSSKKDLAFPDYFGEIESQTGRTLPLKQRMVELNGQRRNVKHRGIVPSIEECRRFLSSAEDFLQAAGVEFIGQELSTISLLDLVVEGDAKVALQETEEHIRQGRFAPCLIACRKAIYHEIERRYSVASFRDAGADTTDLFLSLGSSAPVFARSKKYIEESVHDPTDYIVLDHDDVEKTILRAGINPTDFWNVWRLTPELFFETETGEWIVKYDFDKLEGASLRENTHYVYPQTVDIVLSFQKQRRREKMADSHLKRIVFSKSSVKVYRKASRAAMATDMETENAAKGQVFCDYLVTGLERDGTYYHVAGRLGTGRFILGYVHETDVTRIEEWQIEIAKTVPLQ